MNSHGQDQSLVHTKQKNDRISVAEGGLYLCVALHFLRNPLFLLFCFSCLRAFLNLGRGEGGTACCDPPHTVRHDMLHSPNHFFAIVTQAEELSPPRRMLKNLWHAS